MRPPAPRLDRVLLSLAATATVLSVIALAGGFWADALLGDAPGSRWLDWAHWSSTVPGVAFCAAGTLIAAKLPRHPIAWLLILSGLAAAEDGFCCAYGSLAIARDGDLPLADLAVFLGARTGPLQDLTWPILLLFFPDGRLPSPRWRIPAAVAVTGLAAMPVLLAIVPWQTFVAVQTGAPESVPGLDSITLDPLAVDLPDAVWDHFMIVVGVIASAAFLTGIAAFARRFAGSDPIRRAQLRWLLLGVVAQVLLIVLDQVVKAAGFAPVTLDYTFLAGQLILTAAVVVAVLRYRLYGADLLLGWTLLYGSLAAAVVAIDLAVFVGVGHLVGGDRLAGVAAAGVVAVLYSPLRVRLQRLVHRVLTGRGEPYDVVSALARRLEETPGPDELLAEVARGVATAFRSPYVRVELDRADGTTMIVEQGETRPDTVVLPFAYRDTPIGRLALVPRLGARLSDRDQRLLADVVRQAAAAARATALTEELQRSREELVTGIAEERRRLRRDLHDGLGPALAAAGLKIQAARNLARRDPAAADATLKEVGTDLSDVLADVRRLVHDLRPPALDQFGLLGAIEQQASGFDAVTVHASGDLSGLPAAVEVAAYRIVGEALANVARHAGATRCTVDLVHDGETLRLQITDDGRGLPAGAHLGVGIVAMRERAEELGGTCRLTRAPSSGTRVTAALPARTEAFTA
ncbi:sensor histidine kinase [Actinocorallia longicatena]|uniref:Histidine kinase/HSP90-like ATPase domain-containing protein n=1 Tax=Actinocorallia longicatena TaxID=111803 RepID=A0ABP6QLQ8_9ACTN